MSADELDAAEMRLLNFVQRGAYPRDLERLKVGCALDKGNQMSRLTPCLDDGLLVVGGRLQASDLLTTSSDSARPASRDDTVDSACA